MRLKLLFLALSLMTIVAACGDDDDTTSTDGGSGDNGNAGSKSHVDGKDGGKIADTDPGAAPDAGSSDSTDSASVKITAADGGKVVLGKASLNIPADALASDLTITVETSTPGKDLPDSSSLKGMIYDFGPDGTKFSEPATLTLPSAGKPGADEEAVISWLDEKNDTWQNLATTVNKDGTLSAEVSHFTSFVVRFNGVISGDCGFDACGGDVVGTWKVTGVCAEISGPVLDECPDALAMLDLTLTGSATFNKDGTRSTDFTSKSTITYKLSTKCLDTITMGHPPTSCDVLSKDADPTMDKGATTCSGDPTDACTCVEDSPEKSETKTGTYTIDGSTMTTTDDDDGSTSTADFCVNDSGEARFKGTDGLAVLTWIAKKQ